MFGHKQRLGGGLVAARANERVARRTLRPGNGSGPCGFPA